MVDWMLFIYLIENNNVPRFGDYDLSSRYRSQPLSTCVISDIKCSWCSTNLCLT